MIKEVSLTDGLELDPKEERAIRAFRRLEKIWPESLWVFAGQGDLHVLKSKDDRQMPRTEAGYVDYERIVAKIKIHADGGDY